MKAAVRLIKVTKSFQKERVLKGITHSFEAGKIHGIMGFNGSGKTVMFKCICGFMIPDKGRVIVQARQIGKDTDFPPSVGMIIESPGFLPHLTGFANLKRLAAIKRLVSDEQIRESIARVGLDPFSKKKVGQYSLGMRERLGIAQAIMEDPSILVLDEPFNGLDKMGVLQMHELILSLKTSQKTILLSSHSQKDIDVLCDIVCEMDDGKLKCIKDNRGKG